MFLAQLEQGDIRKLCQDTMSFKDGMAMVKDINVLSRKYGEARFLGMLIRTRVKALCDKPEVYDGRPFGTKEADATRFADALDLSRSAEALVTVRAKSGGKETIVSTSREEIKRALAEELHRRTQKQQQQQQQQQQQPESDNESNESAAMNVTRNTVAYPTMRDAAQVS